MKRALFLSGLLLCGRASAQDGVRFRYTAPPECPTEAEFRAEVQRRLLREARAGVSVEVRLEPAERRAWLLFQEAGAPAVERTVEGDSCTELAHGLAVITALSFGAAEEPKNAPPPRAPPGAETRAPDPASAPARGGTEPRLAPPDSARSQRPERASGPTPSPESPAPAMEAGAGGWLNTWSAPGAFLGADGFIRLSPGAAGGWSLRLSGLYGFSESTVRERSARFMYWGGRAEGCPVSRGVPLGLLVEACLALDLGALGGRGEADSALREAASRSVLFAAGVLTGRLRVQLGGRFSLEGQAELGVPLVRHEFLFGAPAERIFRTPAVGFAGRLGLGVKFL